MTRPDAAALARMIDHTALKTETTSAHIEQLCREARQWGCVSVCVNPVFVAQAARLLDGSAVKVCSVVGFPLGASRGEIKAAEARLAIADGATEIDTVMAVGALLGGDEALALDDLRQTAVACHAGGALLKAILETHLLTDSLKVRACELCIEAGVDFVKTSTGMFGGGATAEDIALMARAVASHGLGVKASGGVRTYDDACRMIDAGATRIGASATVAILTQAAEGR